MSNDFKFYGSEEGAKDFIQSSITTANEVISHYDFVINDLSSEISDKHLEATKEPTVRFLFQMRHKWFEFRITLENQLAALEKKNS